MVTVAEVMHKKFLKLDANSPVTHAIASMIKEDERYALVFSKKYLGMVDRFVLIESKLSPMAKIKTFVSFPPTVKPETSLIKAAELMYHSYPCVLPVVRKGKIIGVVRGRDILKMLPDIPALAKLKVSEVATTELVTLPYTARIGDAINILKEKGISHIPVVDRQRRLVGVFSLTDLFKRYLMRPAKVLKGVKRVAKASSAFTGTPAYVADTWFALDTNIGDLSSVTALSASPSETLGKAVKEMFAHKVSDIVVVEDRRPVGIITTRNLLETFFRLSAPEYWGIQFVGCRNIPGILERSVREQIAEFYSKIRKDYFRDIIYFLAQIKLYEPKPTKRKKYSVHLRLAIPSKIFNTEMAHFDLNTAVSWAIDSMDRMLLRFREKTRQRREKGKKGRRAVFEHYIQRAAERANRESSLRRKLVKRK